MSKEVKTKRVIWERSGLEIPGVGMTKEGIKSKPLPIHQADEFVKRGIAKDIKAKATDKPVTTKKGGKD